MPRARRIALIANVQHPGETKGRDTAQSAATALDLGVRYLPVKSEADLEAALANIARQRNLLTYGPLIEDVNRRLAEYVDKILDGAKPAVLQVELPTRVQLVVNLKTAKALGLTILPSVLLRADEVIE